MDYNELEEYDERWRLEPGEISQKWIDKLRHILQVDKEKGTSALDLIWGPDLDYK